VSDDMSQPDPSARAQVNVQVDDELRHGVYANFLVVSHSPHEFTLDFCQVMPRSGADATVTAEVVSRVKIAPTMVGRVLTALNTNMANYEEKFGSVKHIA
jgi:Protein of unknown function (DUF3467)